MTTPALVLAAATALLAVVVLALVHRLRRRAAEHARALQLLREQLALAQERGAEQARQFEAATREIEGFSYSVSHDLRQPLRIVDGFANILLEDYGARLDELFREHVGRVIAAAARMNAMIEALLALSQRTGQQMQRTQVDLSAAATALAAELQAGEPGRHVEFRIAPGLLAQGDPELLRLVLQNLLANAFKFSAQAPQACIEVGCEAAGGGEAFFVRDNGAGFDMRFASRLFGLFQRLHSQNEFPGTGVGLATVQRIIARHGGRVWARAEPGQGACFYFSLPAGGAAAAAPAGPLNAGSR